MESIYLFGASGHGKVVKEILQARGNVIEAFIDDNREVNECAGCVVLHEYTGLSPIIVSIGINHVRKVVVGKLMDNARINNKVLKFVTAIHPTAIISPSAKIGEGTVVMPGVIINADVVIGNHCIINTGATVDHDCVIGDYCHIAPGVNISGATNIAEGTWVGVGASVIQGLKIGENCMIGAGSVVVEDIPGGVVAYGNPCRIIKNI